MLSRLYFPLVVRDFDEIEISCSPSEFRGRLSHSAAGFELQSLNFESLTVERKYST